MENSNGDHLYLDDEAVNDQTAGLQTGASADGFTTPMWRTPPCRLVPDLSDDFG